LDAFFFLSQSYIRHIAERLHLSRISAHITGPITRPLFGN
jgi:hypothetical protein